VTVVLIVAALLPKPAHGQAGRLCVQMACVRRHHHHNLRPPPGAALHRQSEGLPSRMPLYAHATALRSDFLSGFDMAPITVRAGN